MGGEEGVIAEQTPMPSATVTKSKAKAWPKALLSHSARLADNLNERFVGAAGRVTRLLNKTEQAVSSKISKKLETEGDADKEKQRAVEADLARWSRIRLSDLHLRVGQCIYQLDRTTGETTSSVRRQLLALLDEIERLEEVLLRANGEGTQEFPSELMLAADQLVPEVEPEQERTEKNEVP